MSTPPPPPSPPPPSLSNSHTIPGLSELDPLDELDEDLDCFLFPESLLSDLERLDDPTDAGPFFSLSTFFNGDSSFLDFP